MFLGDASLLMKLQVLQIIIEVGVETAICSPAVRLSVCLSLLVSRNDKGILLLTLVLLFFKSLFKNAN